MESDLGINTTTDAVPRDPGGYVGTWTATWVDRDGKRQGVSREVGIFADATSAKAAAEAALLDWLRYESPTRPDQRL